jgi:hypothetical protein
VRHSIEVTAETLYEAAAIALSMFREPKARRPSPGTSPPETHKTTWETRRERYGKRGRA